MTSNQIAPANTLTVKTDIRFYELLLCSCIAPNQPLPKIAIGIAVLTLVGGIWYLLGGGVLGSTLLMLGLFMAVIVVAAVHKNYQANRRAFEGLTVTVSPAGVTQRVENTNSEARYEWARVGAVRRAGGVVLMWIDSQAPAWVCVPMRCLPNADAGRTFYRTCFDFWREGQVRRHELGHKAKRARTRPVVTAVIALLFAIVGTMTAFITIKTSEIAGICSILMMLEALILVPLLYKLDDGTQSLMQANNALIANDPKRALAICDKALQRHKKNSRLLTVAGYSAYTIGEFDRGVEFCRQAVAANADDALAYAGLAFGQREQGFLDEAFENIGKAIELQPNIPWAYVIRANVLSDWARYDEALKEVEEAERWEGNGYSPLHCRAAILSCMYELDEALRVILKAEETCIESKRSPKELAAVLGTKSLIHSRRREFNEARAMIERADQLDPGNPITAAIKASVAVRASDLPYAAQALGAARELPLPARSLYIWYCDMAIYQYKKHNVVEALQNADLGIATARRALPLAVKGAILVREGRREEALPLLEDALALDSFCMLAYESRARVREALGDAQGAADDRARFAGTGIESFF